MDTSDLSRVVGRVLEPGDGGFDEARALWNTRFDRRPDLVVRCTSSSDVKASIDYAREHEMQLSVKGGGHSYAANSVADGGLLIDLSLMKAIRVDAEARTVTVEGGVTCAEMDAATQEFGLATPTATVSSVGVIGAALGGGAGYLSRKFGLMIDNMISAEVVTADGRKLRAASDENADLFWALRGGGGNFGVVTSLELRLHDVGPQVLSGQIVFPFDNAGAQLRFFRDFMAEAPDEFQCYPFCFRVPPIDVFPEEFHGQPVLDFVLYHQDPDAADFVLPLRELGEPILEEARLGLYVNAQTGFDANLPKGQRYISKAHDLDGLSDGAIDTMVEFVPRMVGPLSAAYFDPLGGAIGRVDPSATPYGGRGTKYGFHLIAGWMDPAEDESVLAWASEFQSTMAAHATGGVYVSLIADDETNRIPAAYDANYRRLVELKQQWDPANLFSSNYNIPPG
ncbi:MAG: FAD-binding oxidoreductase [Acidimicrobiia bacterium]|nr:MAG: FAD-binding oxidoreductase [Acidimicrobiia bacterium]